MSFFDKVSSSKPIKTKSASPVELTVTDTSSSVKEEVSFILTKVKQLKGHLNQCFIEREEAIENLFLALATGSNLLLLGPPGTGKSHLITELTKHIEEARLFSWLLNRTSDPAEIVGPFSMKAMEQDQFIRVTTGKLPEAEIVFLDELFKANEPVLNICLPLINEKVFYNGPTPTKVPLISLFAASNEFPAEDEGLEALYDRLLLRMWVDYIKEPVHRLKLLQSASQPRPTCSTRLTLSEIQTLQQACQQVKVTHQLLQHLNTIVSDLGQKGLTISDRRLVKCLDVLKAQALLNGRMTAYTDDLKVLTYVLWEKEGDFDIVCDIISSKMNPYREELSQIQIALQDIQTRLPVMKQRQVKEQQAFYTESDKKIKKLATLFNDLYKKASSYGVNPSPYLQLKEELLETGRQVLNYAIQTKANS